MDQVETYQFKRDIFVKKEQSFFLISQEQAISDDFYQQNNIDKDKIIEIKKQIEFEDYIKLIEVEASTTKNILFLFSSYNKSLVIQIIIRYLKTQNYKYGIIQFNSNTLDQLNSIDSINRSELLPPKHEQSSENSLQNAAQINQQVTQQINQQPSSELFHTCIDQQPQAQINSPPTQIYSPPTQINSQINHQIILEPLPVIQTFGLTRKR